MGPSRSFGGARHPLLIGATMLALMLTSTVDAFSAQSYRAYTRVRTLRCAQKDSRGREEQETQDERLNRLLRERIEELDMMNDDKESNETPSQTQPSLFQFRLGSLEILALVVSAFFVATVAFSDGAIFAPPATTTAPRVVLDADEILKQDFARDSSSVRFGVEEK